MILLHAPLRILSAFNAAVLAVGRQLAWVCLGIMVVVILAQIFFRYVIGDALAWSEELARFFMLWMTGLIAPSAYRWGGFVAIDMLPQALPARAAAILNLALLAVALTVLVVAVRLGWADVTGFGGRFATASLWVPAHLEFGWVEGPWLLFERTLVVDFIPEPTKIAKKYMMASLLVSMVLMTLVNVELILRSLIRLLDPATGVVAVPEPAVASAGAD
ncbi:TRAP transporter small permease [Halovulum marinum]|nr:TRAP transporter small permease subunit [Halovulum marinum]